MQSPLQDVIFAIRQLRKNPGFALTTILTLGLGIGAATAIFSLVNSVLLRPLPFPDPSKIVSLQIADHRAGALDLPDAVSYPDFFDWRAQSRSFTAIASIRNNSLTLTGSGDPQQLQAKAVSADFFRVLGVEPELGRGFLREEEKPGTHVAVLSHELWQSTFGGAKDIVGRTIILDAHSYTVVGVMPGKFEFPLQTPKVLLWTTLADNAVADAPGDTPDTAQRGLQTLEVIGRLKPGVSLAQAHAELNLICRNLAAQYPSTNKNFTSAYVAPELDELVGSARPALRVLFAAVVFVLLIACANVAGLLLARASRRSAEMAVRSALGATRLQIVRQIMVESVLLSLLGGAFGVALSIGLLRAFLRFVPQNLPRLDQVSVDGRVLLFATAASILTGLLFGVLPAWRMSNLDPALALRDGGRSVTSGRSQHRLHGGLVIIETAIGLMLLVGSGLLIRSFVRVLQVDPGFNPQHLLTASLTLPAVQYPPLKEVDFYDQLLRRVAALPGVQSVAGGNPLPLSTSSFLVSFSIQGQTYPPGEAPNEFLSVITPGFFSTMQIPLLQGRDFNERDNSKSGGVIIVNEAFARKYFPGQGALGKHIKSDAGDSIMDAPMREVIGVVGNTKRHTLTSETQPQYYLPFAQAILTSPRLVIRTAGDPVNLIGPLREQVAEIDKNVPLFKVQTFDSLVSTAAAQPRFQTLLITGFAMTALLLSAIGLYAVLSYMVAQRSLEIGLRIALGAQRGDVLGMVLRRGLKLAALGIAIGIVLSILLTRFMAGMLYGVQPFDPITFAGVSLVLLAVSLIASSAPAFRASRLDPMRTLRNQ